MQRHSTVVQELKKFPSAINPKAHHHVHTASLSDHVLSHFNPVHTLPSRYWYIIKSNFSLLSLF
jgi:hypothetical protein